MPQAFTPEQMERIRKALFESACRHAVTQGVKKTSLEQLTADAGISKSTFYKFYDSKEKLFLQVGGYFEMQIVGEAERALRRTVGEPSSKVRTAAAVNAAFDKLAALNVMRFMKEDMPQLIMYFSTDEAALHFKSMARSILDLLKREHIRFCVEERIVGSIIHILYLSMQHAQELDNFTDALRELVLSACERIVA